MGRLLLLSVISTLLVVSRAEADAVLAENVPSELLQAEHRAAGGRSAEPDSFLDRIADLFGGSNKKKPQQKVSRPPGPVYRPNIPLQKQQESVQRLQKVPPPAGFINNGLQTSASNIKRQTTGEMVIINTVCVPSRGTTTSLCLEEIFQCSPLIGQSNTIILISDWFL